MILKYFYSIIGFADLLFSNEFMTVLFFIFCFPFIFVLFLTFLIYTLILFYSLFLLYILNAISFLLHSLDLGSEGFIAFFFNNFLNFSLIPLWCKAYLTNSFKSFLGRFVVLILLLISSFIATWLPNIFGTLSILKKNNCLDNFQNSNLREINN